MEIKFFWKDEEITDLTNYLHGGNSARDSLIEALNYTYSKFLRSEGVIWIDLFEVAKENQLGYWLEGFSEVEREELIKNMKQGFLGLK